MRVRLRPGVMVRTGLAALALALPAFQAPAQQAQTRGVRIIDAAPEAPAPPAAAIPPASAPPQATPGLVRPHVPALSAPPAAAPAPPPLAAPSPPPLASPPAASLPVVPPQAVAPPPRMMLPAGPIPAENSAGVKLEIVQGQELRIGQRIALRVSTRRAGYLVLADVDATGKVTQIYPNVRSLMMTPRSRETANLIQAGQTVTIPNPNNLYAGFELVAAPPPGVAMVVAMLSDRPVQLVDLPDVPPDLAGQIAGFAFLQQAVGKLRIAAAEGSAGLIAARWSFDAKFYLIR